MTRMGDSEIPEYGDLSKHEKYVLKLQKELQSLRSRLERMTDLVRYQRGPLLEAELITQEEYTELLQVDGAVARLHGYDVMRSRLTIAMDALREIEEHEHLDPNKAAAPYGRTAVDIGHANGHRCCATIAREGLKRMEGIK